MSADAHYPWSLRALHAAMALLVLPQWALGFVSERTADDTTAMALLRWHFQLGVLLAALWLLRVGTRAATGVPPPHAGARWQRRMARLVHLALYACLLALPASGYVIWVWMGVPRDVLGLFTVPALFTPPAEDETLRALAWYVHVGSAWTLAVLVGLHLAAAIGHHLRDAGRTYLHRMRPW